MAQQPPALIIIARHGFRLDAADPRWHLSTPTPYDPPLTYGGWNQCRSLGVRIAGLLHAREQDGAATSEPDKTVKARDFALGDHQNGAPEEPPRKRRRIKHKVVIHSSPFLRCLQTSVAIAAGMAQYKPTIETTGSGRRMSKSGSPRSRPAGSPLLPPVPESDMAHTLARKSLQQPKRYRKSTLRVDAFLGEWMNPEYFQHITPPPPSTMMMTTAKAELMENETVDIFAPTVSQKSSGGSLWNGAQLTSTASRESPLDDWSPVEEAVPASPLSPSRRRASQGSAGGGIDRPKSPFRPGSALQPLTSTLPKQEISIYHPPVPQYAVSTSDQIPRGYVAHARNACTNVDYQWDSSRPPLDWGDGGEYGEEWSSMHKRIRRGLSNLIQWYSQHDADARSEDALGLDQAERRPLSKSASDEEEQEDVVVILVTHGAGCNALIGALTGQPVLIDVGMASLTVAVRKDDTPSPANGSPYVATSPLSSPTREPSSSNGFAKLSSVYDLKLIASTEHLRFPQYAASPPLIKDPFKSTFGLTDSSPRKSNTSALLGSIRRPSAANALAVAGDGARSLSTPPDAQLSEGLWRPASRKTEDRPGIFVARTDDGVVAATRRTSEQPLDMPSSGNANGTNGEASSNTLATMPDTAASESQTQPPHDHDTLSELPLPNPGDTAPSSLKRGLSQKGLWGSQPKGARVERTGREVPKRRWTVDQE